MKQPHDEFATKLRDEAERETPEFSDELHTRVMAAVRREKVRAAGSLSLRRLLVVPVGAGLAVLVSVVVWMVQPSSPPVPSPLVELPTVPALDEVIRETTGPVRQTLQDARFAYLDRDGKRLAKFLWRSIPVTPHDSHDHTS
jgi:hypothetical protein